MSILDTLINVSILSSVLIGAVILTRRAFRNKLSAVLISALWMIVLLRLLMPFSIETQLHIGSMIPEWQAGAEETDLYAETDGDAAPVEGNTASNEYTISEAAFDAVHNENNIENNTQPTAEQNEPAFFQRAGAYIKTVNLESVLLSLWVIVGAMILISGFLSLAVFTRKLRVENVVSAKLYNAFIDAKCNTRVNQSVRILESNNVDMPMTFGLIHPKIVVPKEMVNAIDAKKLRLIITHELVHIKRLDILKNYLWLLAKAIHWFNPLVWIGYRMYLSDMEIICDTKVIEKVSIDQRAEYSQSLVDAAKLLTPGQHRTSPILLSFCEENCKLRRRIMNIMKPSKKSRSASLAVLLIILVLIGTCFTTACQKDSNTEIFTENKVNLSTDEQAQIDKLLQEPVTDLNASFESDGVSIEVNDVSVAYLVTPDGLDRVYLPQMDKYPTAEYKLKSFDEDFTQKIAEYFIGNDYYYALGDTKIDYEKRLEDYKAELEKLNNTTYNQSELNQHLYYLERKLASSAPENVEAELKFKVDLNAGFPQEIQDKADARSLNVKSYTEDGIAEMLTMYEYTIGWGNNIHFRRGDLLWDYRTFGMHKITGADMGGEFKDKFLTNALAQSNQVINDLSEGMELSNIYVGKIVPVPFVNVYNDFDLYAMSDRVCASFVYTRPTDGISSVAGQIVQDVEVQNDLFDSTYFPSTEIIEVIVDETGVISFYWVNAMEEVGTSPESVEIISLQDAVDNSKEYVYSEDRDWSGAQKNSVYSEETGALLQEYVHIVVDEIYLAMMPVRQENGYFEVYPFYVFKGSGYSRPDTEPYILAVNAIDGSVINYLENK